MIGGSNEKELMQDDLDKQQDTWKLSPIAEEDSETAVDA